MTKGRSKPLTRDPKADKLVGTVVTARPLGWDDDPNGVVTEYDILDPYDGPKEPFTGKLTVRHVPARLGYNAYTDYMIDGRSIDVRTIEIPDAGRIAEVPKPTAKPVKKRRRNKGQE
jgi:hypothetical protein